MKLKQVVATLSVVIALLSGAVQAAPTYWATDLGTLGGIYSSANGINGNQPRRTPLPPRTALLTSSGDVLLFKNNTIVLRLGQPRTGLTSTPSLKQTFF